MNHTYPEAITPNCAYFVQLLYYLFLYGNYAEALSISQRLASLYESAHGERHGSTIRMKWRMAEAYYFLKKYADSVQLLNAILPDAKSVLGTKHGVTMSIQSRLAACLSRIGDGKKALQMLDEIIPVSEHVFGENHPNVLIDKFNKEIGRAHV